jgi:hypothetical protein
VRRRQFAVKASSHFSGVRFDLEVLAACGNIRLLHDKSLDILKDLERHRGSG